MDGIDERVATLAACDEYEPLAHVEEETEECEIGESPYEIGAIQEEDELLHDDDALVEEEAAAAGDVRAGAPPPVVGMHDAASAMRPLVTMSGELSDWVECVNADGDTYYCNLVTSETLWQPPFEPLPVLSGRHSARTGILQAFPLDGGGSSDVGDAAAASQFVKRVLDGSLRRLDPHTQLQLEEARRRHKELEELRDEEVLMGGEHWVEMYDPTHDGFYYYGVHSGEMRWDRPDSYVMQIESDDILRMVVRMQCVFRMKLARRKVFLLKMQRAQAATSSTSSSSSGEATATHPWVEVYDPFHKVLYYYCAATNETRWDPPTHFISAAEDREMAAAIAIQSMSRSHLARRDVKKRKTTLRKRQQEQALEESRRLRELRRREYFAKSDGERESICRRELLDEESEQIRDGDLFWGVDRHDQEVLRQQAEEKLLADAEAFWQRVNRTLRLRVEMEMQRSKEDDALRRESELISEADESDRMCAAEADQCMLGDCFWGIQAEEKAEEKACRDLDAEEARSRLVGEKVSVEDLHYDWKLERECRIEQDKTDRVVAEKRDQRQYFRWFYRQCATADDVLDYLWPTHRRFEPPPLPSQAAEGDGDDDNSGDAPESDQQQQHTPDKPAPYVLDDVVLRERLATDYRYGGKSILTIHDPSHARVLGRRGQYLVSQLDTDAVFVAAAKKAGFKPRPTSPTRPMPASSKPIPNDNEEDEEERIRFGMFPALHYRPSRAVPDPHLLARYNGVPFRPSEMSPTREILLGHHTKLTQLPSLAGSSHSKKNKKPSPKRTHHKSPFPSPLVRPKKKHQDEKKSKKHHSSFFLAMQETNNNAIDPLSSSLGFSSPFFRVAQATRFSQSKQESPDEKVAREARERAQRVRAKYAARFAREELAVVREVFEIMDFDGSGTIDKKEMVWALQRDGEVHCVARQSALLRLLLKQQSHLEELFKHLRMSDVQRDEISWDIFRVFCEEMYISLSQQGIVGPHGTLVGASPSASPTKKTKHHKPPAAQASHAPQGRASAFVEVKEEQLVRRVFALCDQDGNGVLEIDELQHALYASPDKELQELVRASQALQPLLHEDTFIDAFRKFEPLDPRGISQEEFVVLCLEIADIARLNGML